MNEDKGLEIVDRKTGELMERTPEDMLMAASEAAKALERVIQLNERPPLIMNGRRYLEFHHWQTVGKFYHVTVRTLEAHPCEIDGVKGFQAKAEVIDEKTGIIVGGAEAYCFRDEPNWKSKPLFQLASMAQTRAASKALANKFRFVAIVAGYEGTPSEEMTAEPQQKIVMPKAKEIGGNLGGGPVPTPYLPGDTPTGDGQRSKFFDQLHKVVREKGLEDVYMKQMMKQLFRKDHSSQLTDAETAALIKAVEAKP